MQYIYQDGDGYVFMDNENLRPDHAGQEWVGDQMLYLKENDKAAGASVRGQADQFLELPATVELKVVETEPSVKGATAAAQYKPATLETGLKISRCRASSRSAR